ncbi:MAG: peptidoglycan DD-metalloendopeptidase family protein [Defluviitaleaceae bacterium]|nr:peptidoglycan DD-metalloendopeptidase family protein [Defluviitaleaceae bacterium]MCL2240199.1 peptidoglycan DD-metalloendopeptidase family protein [Defluviitaleaceae bacterium]
MKQLLKRMFLLAVMLVVILPGLSLGAQVNLQELRNNRTALQRSIASTRVEIQRTQRELNQAEREMEALDEQIMQLYENMAILDYDIALVEERYELAINTLEEARAYRDTQQIIVHERLRALHEHGQPSLLDVLVQSTSVRDFMLRMEWMTQIARQDQQMLQRLEDAEVRYLASVEDEARLRNTLESLMHSLERTVAELDDALAQWEATHDRLLGERATFEEMLAADQAQERTMAQQIAREEERIRAEQERERQRQLAAMQANLSGGTLDWPTPGFWHISSPYGNRPNPFNRRQTQFHSGIDIAGRGIMGANVVAARDGFVSRAATGWNGGYGTMIIIEHGNGLSTLYAHLSAILVREGQEVFAGQVIGRVGSTGNSTGPHLHFEVRQNNRHTNPGPFLGLR